MNIQMTSIGSIVSPYEKQEDMPIQGCFKPDITACAVVDSAYQQGLLHLDQFSHAILIYYFHQSKEVRLLAKPFLEDELHGVFAIRSPYRPNHIGISIVRIKEIIENRLYFYEPDMFNGTPLLDIKPYVSHFDYRNDVTSGWIDKHFESDKRSPRVFISDENRRDL